MPDLTIPQPDDSTRVLVVKLHRRLRAMEDTLSRLDDSVSGLLEAVNTEVTDLRAKLAQAQADDATAAELAADVEENLARLDAAAAQLRENDETAPEEPVEPTDPEAPVEPEQPA